MPASTSADSFSAGQVPAYSVDYVAVRGALVAAIMLGTGLNQNHVVLSEPEQPGWPRPSLPYMTFKVIAADISYGDDVPTLLDSAADTYNLGGPRGMAVSFQTFGRSKDEANGLLALFKASLGAPAVQQCLGAAGIAVGVPGPINDLSMLLQTGYEGRAAMECRFNLASNLVTQIPSVGTVNVQGSITIESGGTQPVTIQVEP